MASLATATICSNLPFQGKPYLSSLVVISRNARKSASLDRIHLSVGIRKSWEGPCTRASRKISTVHATSSGLENLDISTSPFNGFSVAANIFEGREMKIRVDVSGVKTQATFDDVFSKLVAAAQPIPGFRRVKGGKTPDIPKDALLHIIGPSKVNKLSIKEIINCTVAEYVEKEGAKVTKDLRVEQSLEELEAAFLPGKSFGFDAVIQLQETNTAKC